jgi:hypothetical protein
MCDGNDNGTVVPPPFEFTVNRCDDGEDDEPGDTVCSVIAGEEECTLRAAITESNALWKKQTNGSIVILPHPEENGCQVRRYHLGGGDIGIGKESHLEIVGRLTIKGGRSGDMPPHEQISSPEQYKAAFSEEEWVYIDGKAETAAFSESRVFHIKEGAELTLSNVVIVNGSSAEEGGAILHEGSKLTLNYASIGLNSASSGGGIHSTGMLTLTDVFVGLNIAHNGGGIYSGSKLSLTGVFVVHNSASSDGDSCDGSGGGVFISGAEEAVIDECIVYGNSATATGGGIANLGSLTEIRDTTISHNKLSKPSCEGKGGGIHNGVEDGDEASLLLRRCTINGNEVTQGSGGGCYNAASGYVALVNSTISGNSAKTGGGVTNDGDARFFNVTIYKNKAVQTGGGLFGRREHEPTTTVKNSIIAGNNALEAGPDCHGVLSSESTYNLVGDGSDCEGVTNGEAGNQVGTSNNKLDPLLSSLADNEGLTKTHALQDESPAIDRGSPTDEEGCIDHYHNPLRRDQRDYERPAGEQCDIGAYESQGRSQP